MFKGPLAIGQAGNLASPPLAHIHLESRNITSPNQHRFREGRSVDTAKQSIINRIEDAKRISKHVLVLSIDIKGTFDNLQHQAIMNSLIKREAPDNIVQIFISLLHNRLVTMQTQQGKVSKEQGLEEGGGLITAGESSKSSDMLYSMASSSYKEDELISASASDSRNCKSIFSNGGRTAIGRSSVSTEVGLVVAKGFNADCWLEMLSFVGIELGTARRRVFFNLFWFVTSLKSVTSGKAKASSLTGATDGEDGIFNLVIGGDDFVESDGLELGTAEPSGFFWTDGAENEFFCYRNITISGLKDNLYNAKDLVSLVWVKAHAGNPGNELADHFAKIASSCGVDMSIPAPYSYVKRVCKEFLMNEWNSYWKNSTTGKRREENSSFSKSGLID
ncbi:hypothetical protein AVEN_272991-1 [Araneus ventricosus]|uniref:Reverse transcriptase domain-containing protein n=1 Tax=Araneus ventricosus TaxID=182803 RepID=A0A4Y2EXB2_ARAVE|nr:hypothetical protein AVEN_272991-1 [Araneus ventricosus]